MGTGTARVYASRLDVQPADEAEDGEKEEEPPQGTVAPTGSLARIWVTR
jgi:hypothetical protein